MAKDFMAEHGVSFEELDVSQDARARDEMIEKTQQLGVPVIDVDGEVMVGYQKTKLAELLKIT